MAERYTVRIIKNNVVIYDGERYMAHCGDDVEQNREDAALIAKALNKLAELESVTSIGTANEEVKHE